MTRDSLCSYNPITYKMGGGKSYRRREGNGDQMAFKCLNAGKLIFG